MCFIVYVVMVMQTTLSDDYISAKQTSLMNGFATIGDFLFIVHDWLFTNECFRAALQMPLTFGNISGDLAKYAKYQR